MARLSLRSLFGNRGTATRARFSGGSRLVRPQQALIDQQKLIQENNQSDISLQDQIINLQTQLVNINNGLTNIYGLLLLESEEEKLRVLSEQKRIGQETRNNRREASEAALEGVGDKISSAIEKPVQKVQNKLGNIFDRIKNFFLLLGVGWLTNQGLKALEAARDGAIDELKKIKDNIIDKITKAVTLVGAVWRGINRLISSFLGIGKSIGKLLIKGARKSFQLLGKLAKVTFKTIRAGFAAVAPDFAKKLGIKVSNKFAALGAKVFGKKIGSELAETAAQKTGIKVGQRFGGRILAGSFPVIGSAVDFYDAAKAYMRGNTEAAGMYAAGGVANLFPSGYTQALSAAFTVGAIKSEFDEGYYFEDKVQLDHLNFSKINQKFKDLTLMDMPPEIVYVEDGPSDGVGSWNPGGAVDSGTDVPAISSSDLDNQYTSTAKNLFNLVE